MAVSPLPPSLPLPYPLIAKGKAFKGRGGRKGEGEKRREKPFLLLLFLPVDLSTTKKGGGGRGVKGKRKGDEKRRGKVVAL